METVAPENSLPRHLIVFGAGYVGGALVADALARGWWVTALTRNSERARALADAGAHVVVADLASSDWHAALPEGAALAVNCVSSGGGGPEGYRRSYVEGLHSILAWSALHGRSVGTLVYTSSTSVYPQSGGVWVTEADPTEGATGTAAILLEAERALLGRTTRGIQRAFVLRLAGIYGPGRHHLLDQLRTGAAEIPGRGDHRLNLIHRDDIVRGLWAALQAPANLAGGIYNLADNAPSPKAEVVAWLAARLGVPVPGFTGGPVAGRRPDPPDRCVSNARVRADLGWVPDYADYRAGYSALLGA